MVVTIDAEDGFDRATCASPARVPTLILAGRLDRFYCPHPFEETALIPGSQLRSIDRRGHITVMRDHTFTKALVGFPSPSDVGDH